MGSEEIRIVGDYSVQKIAEEAKEAAESQKKGAEGPRKYLYIVPKQGVQALSPAEAKAKALNIKVLPMPRKLLKQYQELFGKSPDFKSLKVINIKRLTKKPGLFSRQAKLSNTAANAILGSAIKREALAQLEKIGSSDLEQLRGDLKGKSTDKKKNIYEAFIGKHVKGKGLSRAVAAELGRQIQLDVIAHRVVDSLSAVERNRLASEVNLASFQKEDMYLAEAEGLLKHSREKPELHAELKPHVAKLLAELPPPVVKEAEEDVQPHAGELPVEEEAIANLETSHGVGQLDEPRVHERLPPPSLDPREAAVVIVGAVDPAKLQSLVKADLDNWQTRLGSTTEKAIIDYLIHGSDDSLKEALIPDLQRWADAGGSEVKVMGAYEGSVLASVVNELKGELQVKMAAIEQELRANPERKPVILAKGTTEDVEGTLAYMADDFGIADVYALTKGESEDTYAFIYLKDGGAEHIEITPHEGGFQATLNDTILTADSVQDLVNQLANDKELATEGSYFGVGDDGAIEFGSEASAAEAPAAGAKQDSGPPKYKHALSVEPEAVPAYASSMDAGQYYIRKQPDDDLKPYELIFISGGHMRRIEIEITESGYEIDVDGNVYDADSVTQLLTKLESPLKLGKSFQPGSVHAGGGELHGMAAIADRWSRDRAFVVGLAVTTRTEPVRTAKQIRSTLSELDEMKTTLKGSCIGKDHAFSKEIDAILADGGRIEALKGDNTGEVFFLKDKNGAVQFVIKPKGHGPGGIHNNKRHASPYSSRPENHKHYVKSDIPNHCEEEAEALCWSLAQMDGSAERCSESHLMVMDHPGFGHILDGLKNSNHPDDVAAMKHFDGVKVDHERVCVVQRFVKDSKEMYDVIPGFAKPGARHCVKEDAAKLIDQDSFEQVCIDVWIRGDKDGNGGNFLLQGDIEEIPKGEGSGKTTHRPKEGTKLKLVKIDNALVFPESNNGLLNEIAAVLPNGKQKLSEAAKQRILNMGDAQIEEMGKEILAMGRSPLAVLAFKQRIAALKEMAAQDLTIAEMNQKLQNLGDPLKSRWSPDNAELPREEWEPDSEIIDQGLKKTLEAVTARLGEQENARSDLKPKLKQSRLPGIGLKEIRAAKAKGTRLKAIAGGEGGAYFVKDKEGKNLGVLKPTDEDFLCVNNRKHQASPFLTDTLDRRLKMDIPLYRTAQAEALTWEAACLAGVDHVTEKTLLVEYTSDQFAHISDSLGGEDLRAPELAGILRPRKEDGSPDKTTKLCSYQTFIEGGKELEELVEDLSNDLRDQRILDIIGGGIRAQDRDAKGEEYLEAVNYEERLDERLLDLFEQKDYEDLQLLMWVSFDNDGHPGNFMTYDKPNGKKGIKKIDSGLSWPDKNSHFHNSTAAWPHGEKPLSDEVIDKIKNMDIDAIAQAADEYGMGTASAAFRERMEVLQDLVSREPKLSMHEINTRMTLLGRGNEVRLNKSKKVRDKTAKEWALSRASLEDLERYVELTEPTARSNTLIIQQQKAEKGFVF